MNVHFTYFSIVPVYTCLAECSSGPSSICSGLPSDKNYQSIGFAFHLSRCLVTSVIYIDDYTMHLTLVCRFLAVSIDITGRSLWRSYRITRSSDGDTVRDELYDTDLLKAFMQHASRWRHVIDELQHTFGYRRIDDTVHDTQPESWDDECNIAAAFLDHRRV